MTAPAPNEELLGFLISNPKIAEEMRLTLRPSLFGEYEELYQRIIEFDEIPHYIVLKRQLPYWAETITLLVEATYHVTETILPHLIHTVKDNGLKREIERLCAETASKANELPADELLRQLQEKSIAMQTTELGILQDPEQDVDDYLINLEQTIKDPASAFGLMTGNNVLDSMTTGWHRQDFSVIGARTSIGKSAFAIDNILNLNEQGAKCAIFSLEMSKKQIYNRMVANRLGYSLEAIRTGQIDKGNLPKIKLLRKKLANIYVDDTRGISADYISDTMRKLKRTRGLDFVLVDYLQDVKEQGEANDNGGSALARVCRKLRKGAQEMDCHVQGLSQVDRRVEQRQDKRPLSSDLSGSAGIESCADVIAMLYRDDYYNPNTDKRDVMEMIFTKQRNGKVGLVEFAFHKDSQRILQRVGR